MSLTIRPVSETDWPDLWAMLKPVFRAGDTYAIDPDVSETAARSYWCADTKQSFVAQEAGRVLGTYYLTANFAGNADHICNCGYVTSPAAQGRGVARAMLEHSLGAAKDAGFTAMQYNCVVSTNTRAVALWRAYGFSIVGNLPRAFRHPKNGAVDAYVMFKDL